jgi:hypothetical protein
VLTASITGLGSAPRAVNTGNSPVENNTTVYVFGAAALMAALAVGARRVRIEQS